MNRVRFPNTGKTIRHVPDLLFRTTKKDLRLRADPSVVQVSRRNHLFRDLAVDEADDHTGDTHGEPAEPVSIEGQAGLQERFAGDGYT